MEDEQKPTDDNSSTPVSADPAPVPHEPGATFGPAPASETQSKPQAQQSDGQPSVPEAQPPVPPAPVVVSKDGAGKRRLMKVLAAVIVVIVLVALGWFAYSKTHKSKKTAASAQSKNVALLKVGFLQSDFGKLYPDMPASDYSFIMNEQIFEGLVRYEDGNKLAPDIASTWSNPDDKTWLFTIAKGIKFHDGHTVTAQDVKYSLDKIVADSGSDLSQIFASTIASVTVVGTDQVKITTKGIDPTLLNRLAFLYIIDSKLPAGDEPSQAGTGPYMIKPGTKPTATRVQMVAFDGYHGGAPRTRALDFGTSSSADNLVKDLNAHKFDIVGSVPQAAAAKAKGRFKFVSHEPNVEYLAFNTIKKSPVQNKLVREAIRYAVDSKAISQTVTGEPISQLIPPSIPGYNPAITPYKRDLPKARQLLAQAGYPRGVTLRLSTSDGLGTSGVLVKSLGEAGIKVTVDRHPDFDEFIDYFSGGQAQMYSVNYTSDTLDGLDILSTTLGKSNYDNPKLDTLLTQIGSTTNPATRLKLLQQAETLIDQDVAVVPLYSEKDIWLMDKDYAILQDTPSSLISVYFYKVHLK